LFDTRSITARRPALALLAAAFEVDIAENVRDARLFLSVTAPLDELLVSICRAHDWDAEMGVIYLARLRLHLDPAAGPMPTVWACG
jgi:hypothetical protein